MGEEWESKIVEEKARARKIEKGNRCKRNRQMNLLCRGETRRKGKKGVGVCLVGICEQSKRERKGNEKKEQKEIDSRMVDFRFAG